MKLFSICVVVILIFVYLVLQYNADNSYAKEVLYKHSTDSLAEYNKSIDNLINKHFYTIGMHKDVVLKSKGYPDRNTIRKDKYGTYSLWVYGSEYLYFEDGILVSYSY